MAKQLQLTIPTPCHEDWDAMAPANKGRFCASCQKQVVDFSSMSDRQVAAFFKKPSTGSVCGRFMSDQLERDIEIPKKRIPWVKYFFQFAVPAFLLSIKSSSAKAQGKVVIKKTEVPSKNNLQRTALIGDTILMDEIVIIAQGKLPPVKNFSNCSKVENWQLTNLLLGKFGCCIVPIKKEPVDISKVRDLSVSAIKYLPGNDFACSIVVGGAFSTRSYKKSKRIKAIATTKEAIKDTLAIAVSFFSNTSFKVYPNPVSSGSSIIIENKKIKEGDCTAQLVNQSGQSVYQEEMKVDNKTSSFKINVPAVSAGSYFLVFTNKKSGKKYTEKIIVQ